MKVFVSWSGERSKLLAEALHHWLPGVINAVDPWISGNDIEPGARWNSELSKELEQTKYGIVCVTSENVGAPWLLFEAGALSKSVDESRVVPLFLDLKSTDIKGPLTQFQGCQVSQDEIRKLVIKLNQAVFDAGEKGVEPEFIEASFEVWWPRLKSSIERIPKEIIGGQKTIRSEREIFEEILGLARKIDRSLHSKANVVLHPYENISVEEEDPIFQLWTELLTSDDSVDQILGKAKAVVETVKRRQNPDEMLPGFNQFEGQ